VMMMLVDCYVRSEPTEGGEPMMNDSCNDNDDGAPDFIGRYM
jgi:hypothetical protein